ncbi:hypothetical protein [Paenirhodobacter sp. CAU 1674]|uniref:hypothetical protein n=1 Tax=Paenirhodobacter sp. CAU 1674 TaxID=3032596 RepID=UPI0023DB0BE0|nr:hypothetical protein [Paenirhodobacter sp. CAU 1674]MDF2141237.1 hypothetical protein [Paenirhodobacter sp. CAU 1674]
MIVDLGNGVILNPAHVVSVQRDYYGKYLKITDVLGNVHEVQVKYGETIYEAEERVIAMLSKPMTEEGM